MPKLESRVHRCYVCQELLVKPALISHMKKPDGSIAWRHLWHGSTNLLKETSHTDYAMSFGAARIRAEELLARDDISEQTRLEEKLILQELDILQERDRIFFRTVDRILRAAGE